MKSLSLELVEDRQRQLQNLAEQKQLTAALEKNVEELRLKVIWLEYFRSTFKTQLFHLHQYFLFCFFTFCAIFTLLRRSIFYY